MSERGERPEAMAGAKPTRFEPTASVAGSPFWEASREQRYVLPWCTSCGQPHWFPREFCPHCLATDLEWRPASGDGVVYAVSVMPKPGNPLMAGRDPYPIVLVDLAEGVRVFSTVVGTAPDAVAIGMAVHVAWEPLSDGRHLPVFTLAP